MSIQYTQESGSDAQELIDNSYWLDIIKSNSGFDNPERWISFARKCKFKKVSAAKIYCCPDCGNAHTVKAAQYVYYSNLINLRVCQLCSLVFSDTRINAETIRHHFEHSYKDERYFVEQRTAIFTHIIETIDSLGQRGGKVLDVGGAKGHLMALLKRFRPDLDVIVNDLSPAACEWAKTQYGLKTLCGSASELTATLRGIDVIAMIDVLYYEPNVSAVWDIVPRALTPGGALVIRVPNNWFLILLWQRLMRLLLSQIDSEMCTAVKFFNPEHIYIFSKKYLRQRLEKLGFTQIEFRPSPLLVQKDIWSQVFRLYFHLAKLIGVLSRGRIIITPSMLVVASRISVGGQACQTEGGARKSDGITSDGLVSPVSTRGSDTKERGNETDEAESRGHL